MVCVWLREVGKPGLDMDDPNTSRVLVLIPQVSCVSVLYALAIVLLQFMFLRAFICLLQMHNSCSSSWQLVPNAASVTFCFFFSSQFGHTSTVVLGGCDEFNVTDLLSTLQSTLLQGHMTGPF